MLATTETESAATAARNWLAQFERALAEPNDGLLNTLFHTDSHWRDVLALTWDIKTVDGSDAILRELKARVGRARPAGFRIAPNRTAPRHVMRAGTNAIEAIFRFETADGRGSGVLRLTPDGNDGNTLKAWTLLSALDELKGYQVYSGDVRTTYKTSGNPGGNKWFWGLNGVQNGPGPFNGFVRTLEEAKAVFAASWGAWLNAAGLSEDTPTARIFAHGRRGARDDNQSLPLLLASVSGGRGDEAKSATAPFKGAVAWR